MFLLPAVALLAGCGKPAPVKPDGSSGISGTCLLSAVGGAGERQRWASVRVSAVRVNDPTADDTRSGETVAGGQGEFRLALNPGEYMLGVSDTERLSGKSLDPIRVRVEAGKFTEIVIDYDKLNVRN